MGRYFRMLGIFYRTTLATEMEYRLNFWSGIGLSIFWLFWAAFGAQVFYFNTERIAGWSYPELLVVIGLFFAINGYRQAVLAPNLAQLSEYVRLGTLDYILTKPVDSQFMVSLRFIGTGNWADPLLGGGLVAYGCWRMGYMPSPGALVLFAIVTV